MDDKLISMKAFATWHLSFPIEPARWEGSGGQRDERPAGSCVTPLMQYVTVRPAAAATAMRRTGGGGRKGGKEEQSDGLPLPLQQPPPPTLPPSQEVDDINKKLIILPPASSRGLARAIHCSVHSPPPHTSHSPTSPQDHGLGGGREEGRRRGV